MSDMFWIALELSIPKIGLNIMLSETFKKLDAFKFDGVAESDDTVFRHQAEKIKRRTFSLSSPDFQLIECCVQQHSICRGTLKRVGGTLPSVT